MTKRGLDLLGSAGPGLKVRAGLVRTGTVVRLSRIGVCVPCRGLRSFTGAKQERAGSRQNPAKKGPSRDQAPRYANADGVALAMIYAQTGEREKAIKMIEHLLTVPGELQSGTIYDITLTNLKWRWQWDPLRSDPRFQRIVANPEPATVY